MAKKKKTPSYKEWIIPLIITTIGVFAGIIFTNHYIRLIDATKRHEIMAQNFMTFTVIMVTFFIFIIGQLTKK